MSHFSEKTPVNSSPRPPEDSSRMTLGDQEANGRTSNILIGCGESCRFCEGMASSSSKARKSTDMHRIEPCWIPARSGSY